MSRVSRLLLLAQAVFFLALGTCAVLEPVGLGSNHGWSYYEGRADTAAPYVLGFLVTIALVTYAAVVAARSNAPRGLGWGLAGLAPTDWCGCGTPTAGNYSHSGAATVTSGWR